VKYVIEMNILMSRSRKERGARNVQLINTRLLDLLALILASSDYLVMKATKALKYQIAQMKSVFKASFGESQEYASLQLGVTWMRH